MFGDAEVNRIKAENFLTRSEPCIASTSFASGFAASYVRELFINVNVTADKRVITVTI